MTPRESLDLAETRIDLHAIDGAPGVDHGRIVNHDQFTDYLWKAADEARSDITETSNV